MQYGPVAQFDPDEHVEVEIEDCLGAIEDVVYATETFDVTTIRASTPMYLLSKYIRNNT